MVHLVLGIHFGFCWWLLLRPTPELSCGSGNQNAWLVHWGSMLHCLQSNGFRTEWYYFLRGIAFPSPVDLPATMLRTSGLRGLAQGIGGYGLRGAYGYLGTSGLLLSGIWEHFPSCNFYGILVFWDQRAH